MKPPLSNRSEKGIVLVLTVLVLSILVIVGYALAYSAGVNRYAARNAAEAFERETETASALHYALALLEADARAGRMDALTERWAEEKLSVEVGERRYAILVVDENRKLNVNRAARPPATPDDAMDLRPMLKRLILSLEGRESDLDAICSWIDPESTGSHEDDAPNKSLPMIAGLQAIPDLDSALFVAKEDKPALDALLATHPTSININTASERVLEAVFGDADVAAKVVDQRESSPFRTRSEIQKFLNRLTVPRAVKETAALFDTESDFFTVRIAPLDKGPGEGLSALVSRADDSARILNVRRLPKEGSP